VHKLGGMKATSAARRCDLLQMVGTPTFCLLLVPEHYDKEKQWRRALSWRPSPLAAGARPMPLRTSQWCVVVRFTMDVLHADAVQKEALL